MPEESTPAAVEALAALHGYFVGDATMGDTLTRVCDLVVKAVPVTSFVGITMMVDGNVGTYVFTHPTAPEIDQAQYDTGDGPCLESYRTDRVVQIRSMETETRFPAFCVVARQHGVRSTLSLPLTATAGSLGAMNLYSEVEDAFTPEAIKTADLFAVQSAFVLANAQAYWDARTLSENLETAMESRSVIEQAKGIIMGAQRVTADRAFEILVAQSQHQNMKLRDIAQEIVENSTR